MIRNIKNLTVINVHGATPKNIKEFIKRVNAGTPDVSVPRNLNKEELKS